jgi:hypothetical protein
MWRELTGKLLYIEKQIVTDIRKKFQSIKLCLLPTFKKKYRWTHRMMYGILEPVELQIVSDNFVMNGEVFIF